MERGVVGAGGSVQAYRQPLARRPFLFVAQQAGNERTVPVHQLHLDLEDGLAHVGAASIDDDDDVVVIRVIPRLAPGA